MVTRALTLLCLAWLPLGLLACDPCPEIPMTEGVEGLVITPDEHPDGWGQDMCWSCHAYDALHRRGCSPGVDLGLVRELVEDEDLDSCADCHGDNGVAQ